MSTPILHKNTISSQITLSNEAKKHFLSYLEKQSGCIGFCLSVKKTGCSGLSYVIDYVSSPPKDAIIQPLIPPYQLYIDIASYPYLRGLSIDYVKQGLNYKLVYKNPNQTGECGCGESFTIGDILVPPIQDETL